MHTGQGHVSIAPNHIENKCTDKLDSVVDVGVLLGMKYSNNQNILYYIMFELFLKQRCLCQC